MATNVLPTQYRLDALYLNLSGTTSYQVLNPERIWVTSYRGTEESVPDCGEEDDPEWIDYDGPCYLDYGDPAVFFDQTFVIEVPS